METEGESVELKGLQTYSNYSVAVAAFTRAGAAGDDAAAARVFCMTAEDGECSELWKIRDFRLTPLTFRFDSRLQSRAARRTSGP